jgi:hypothetical protein
MGAGLEEAPHAYVIPIQPDMTRAGELMKVLRAQGIEVSRMTESVEVEEGEFPEGSYIVKAGQPYWRLAKNLLEVQDFPDPALRTYDDSGWTMGHAFNVEVEEIRDREILEVEAEVVDEIVIRGSVAGSGSAGMAVAHYGSNNMITFRYRLRDVAMQVAEESFEAADIDFPAGSFIVTGTAAELRQARAAVEELGLTAAMLSSVPSVDAHEGDAPRIAIYSQWSGTQELGWYRHAFDQFGIPFELIYKERVADGNLERDFDVIIMAAQNVGRSAVMAESADQPSPYVSSEKYKFLGMYGETQDTTGGFGEAGVEAFKQFFEAGGTLIAAEDGIRFPIEMGFAGTIDRESVTGLNAQKPLIQAEIVRPENPVFYGYEDTIVPVKFGQGQGVFRIGMADEDKVLARYVGGDDSVLSGLAVGADALANRAFAVDMPGAWRGLGRVIMFASNPIYRWQNHGEFNVVFNSILNWNDVVQR